MDKKDTNINEKDVNEKNANVNEKENNINFNINTNINDVDNAGDIDDIKKLKIENKNMREKLNKLSRELSAFKRKTLNYLDDIDDDLDNLEDTFKTSNALLKRDQVNMTMILDELLLFSMKSRVSFVPILLIILKVLSEEGIIDIDMFIETYKLQIEEIEKAYQKENKNISFEEEKHFFDMEDIFKKDKKVSNEKKKEFIKKNTIIDLNLFRNNFKKNK